MPRGGARVGAGRRKKAAENVHTCLPEGFASSDGQMPLDYMLAVIRDKNIDASRRDRMAVAAAPYLHPKVGEGGKKDQKQGAAANAGNGRFGAAPPPKLVVNNR